MSRFMRVILGGFAALPLLALSLEASAAAATVGGCVYPRTSVSTFEANFFDDIEISGDPGRRKDQCKDFLKGCTNTVKHVSNCVESGYAAIENAAFKECKEIADPEDRALCQDGLEEDAESFEASLDESESGAKRECHECYEECLAGESCLVEE